MARKFVIQRFESMNEFLCCSHLNELSVVEVFLSAIYFLGFH